VHTDRRRSLRLKHYDYASDGAYFVTICTRGRTLFFERGEIRSIAERCWLEIPDHFPDVDLDTWVVMPNHVHGIIVIAKKGVQLNAPTPRRDSDVAFSAISPPRDTLAVVVRTYKAAVTTLCRQAGNEEFGWQRSYYDRVIRDLDELDRARRYIVNNPLQWDLDEHNPNVMTP
jgi:putative transposase